MISILSKPIDDVIVSSIFGTAIRALIFREWVVRFQLKLLGNTIEVVAIR